MQFLSAASTPSVQLYMVVSYPLKSLWFLCSLPSTRPLPSPGINPPITSPELISLQLWLLWWPWFNLTQTFKSMDLPSGADGHLLTTFLHSLVCHWESWVWGTDFIDRLGKKLYGGKWNVFTGGEGKTEPFSWCPPKDAPLLVLIACLHDI